MKYLAPFRVAVGNILAAIALFAGHCFSENIVETLSGVQCASGEFRGVGVAQSESQALAQARTNIANQIKASVSVNQTMLTKQRVINGNENLSKENNMQIEQNSQLLNAQDAKPKKAVQINGQFSVVACMSRKDAAKPYLARQKQIADSVSIFAQTSHAQKNPKAKKEIWARASGFWRENGEIAQVLQSLGESLTENVLASGETIQNSYEIIKNDYQNFCSGQGFNWKGGVNYGSKMIFAKFSNEFLIESGECQNGIMLSVLDSELDCEYKASIGNYLCLFHPFLQGTACGGETQFFQFPLSPAINVSSKTKRSAEQKLESKIRNYDFAEWKNELKKWNSSCAE